jgi:hypothetical protein
MVSSSLLLLSAPLLIFIFPQETAVNAPKSYINAVLCLTKKMISGIAGTVNRFDDY